MSQDNNGNLNEGMIFLLVLFLIFFLIAFSWVSENHVYFWYFLKYPLVKFYYYIPEEIKPYLFFWIEKINFFGVSNINDFIIKVNTFFDSGLDYVVDRHKSGEVDLVKISRVLTYMYLPYIIIPLLYYTFKSLGRKHYNKPMELDELRLQESEIWPVIKPILGVSFKDINNLDDGPWAMSIRPEKHFFRKDDFLKYIDEDGENYELKRRDDSLLSLKDKNVKFYINKEKFYNYFIEQLGKPWTGLNDLDESEKHLLCILLPKINRDKDKTEEMLALFGNYYSTKKGNITKRNKKDIKNKLPKIIEDVFKQYMNESIQDLINKSYYKNTVFSRLLLAARFDGVLSNGQFLWLRPINRTLFYMMASVGRKLPFFDAAAIWSHFNYEKAINSSISIPKIDKAVDAVDEYFSKRFYNYISIKELEENNNEK